MVRGSVPPISVVVPTRDTRELTLRCLASLENGGVEPAQVIVVDDAGSDGTAEAIAARHPRVHILRNDRTLGFSGAVNRGLAEAEAPILLVLNSDTEVGPGCLERFVRTFEEQEDLGIAGAALFDPDGTPQWSGGNEPSALWLFAASSGLGPLIGRLRRRRQRTGVAPGRPAAPATGGGEPRDVDWVAGTALAMRRAVWEACGPLDQRFALYCQDLDLCLRASRAGWRVRLLPDARVLHHHGATIAGTSGERQDLEHLWSDLVRWAAKWRGAAAAGRTARTLRAGALVRSFGLAIACTLATGTRRSHLRRKLDNVQRARLALRGLAE